MFVGEVQGASADALYGVGVLTDSKFDSQITVRANLAGERPSLEIVGEALGNLPA
jgi:hypothetical protein